MKINELRNDNQKQSFGMYRVKNADLLTSERLSNVHESFYKIKNLSKDCNITLKFKQSWHKNHTDVAYKFKIGEQPKNFFEKMLSPFKVKIVSPKKIVSEQGEPYNYVATATLAKSEFKQARENKGLKALISNMYSRAKKNVVEIYRGHKTNKEEKVAKERALEILDILESNQ